MKSLKFFFQLSVFLSCIMSVKMSAADHYYGRYDDRSHRQYSSYYREYHPNDSYVRKQSYVHPSGGHSEYRVSVSEGYYSCPRGDYISDRPGRCPLDGSVLMPRGHSSTSKPVYTESYDRYYY